MSDLNSVDESQILYHSFNKLVDASKHLMKGSDTEKYIDLGNKYLSTLVAQVIYFDLKLDMKSIKRFYATDFIVTISQRVLGNNDPKKLLVAMGMLCLSKIPQAVDEILNQLSSLINNQVLELSEKEKEKSIFDIDMNKKLNKLHISTDIESQGSNEVSFTEFNQSQDNMNKFTFNLSFSEVLKTSQQIEEEIKKFMENKNYNTVFTHLLQYKSKTFNCDDIPEKDGNLFKHTVKLSFMNFLNQSEIIQFTATQLGTSKQDARSKANKQVLFKFFNAFPYVFKDFLHCIKAKNTTF